MGCVNYMPRLNQKGAVQFLIPLILLVGIIAGVYLVREGPKIFQPKATVGANIFFVDSSGSEVTTTTTAMVNVKVISPEWPQPTIEPTPTSTITPVSTNKPGPKPRPTGKPKPTSKPKPTKTPRVLGESASLVTTINVVLAEDPNFTVNVQTLNFTTDPITYTFSNPDLGLKTLYAKFISSIGTEQNASPFPATIILEIAPISIPSPSPAPANFGKALKITSADAYISTLFPGPLINIGAIALWIKPDAQSLTGANPFVILGKEFAGGEISGFRLSVVNKKVQFIVAEKKSDGTVASKVIAGSTELQANKWYYVSIFNVAGILSMYVNGVQQGSSAGLVSIQDNQDRKLVIGCAKPIDFSCLSPFYGEIDEVVINLFVGVTATPPTTPFIPTTNTLVLYYLDGDAKDASSHHYDGQVTGSLQFVDSTAGACTSTLDTFQGIDRCSGQYETPKYYSATFTCKSGYSSTVQVSGYPPCVYESELRYQAETICETPSPEHCSSVK